MVNCGFTQCDVSDLQDSEVDWNLGRIKRKRSKTQHKEETPEVDYLLCKETFEFLRHHRSGTNTVLLTKSGGLWNWERMVGGKYKSADNIASCYRHLKAKLAREGTPFTKPVKLLRKTSASMLDKHENFGRFAPHFLGHAPVNVSTGHYIRPSTEQLDAAVGWLAIKYGFTPGNTST